jgi:hypothetical protein
VTDHRSDGSARPGRVILMSICAIAFVVNFEHVVQNFRDHGQGHYVDIALACVNELLLFGCGLEYMYRIRNKNRGPVLPPLLGISLGVGVTLWSNLETATMNAGGIAAAGYPGVALLIIVLILETARHARKMGDAPAAELRASGNNPRPEPVPPGPRAGDRTALAGGPAGRPELPPAPPVPVVPPWSLGAIPPGRPTLAELAASRGWDVIPRCVVPLPRPAPIPQRRGPTPPAGPTPPPPPPSRGGTSTRSRRAPGKKRGAAAAAERPEWVARRYEALVAAGTPTTTASRRAWAEWNDRTAANGGTPPPAPATATGTAGS